jgi:uroporphyrinogen-III synthase
MQQPPLAGLRILLTRPAGEGADTWAAAFALAGARPIPYPMVTRVPPSSWQALDDALARLDRYDWLVFTSQSAVAFVVRRLPGARFPCPMRTQIAVVGASTARAVAAHGGSVALVPSDPRQEGLLDALPRVGAGQRVLLPLADGARPLLADTLRQRGFLVDALTAYRTVAVATMPRVPAFDVAVFASPSAVRAFLAGPGPAALAGKTVAVVGPTTAAEAVAHGLRAVVAEQPSVEALISAIAHCHPSQGDP